MTLWDRQVMFCLGPGGVGKTTVSCAVAIAAAKRGRRVLVMTIDPARRLAQLLGRTTSNKGVTQVQLKDGTTLDADVLDTRRVLTRLVERFVPDREESRQLRRNHWFEQLSHLLAGMHEYLATQALLEHIDSKKYDFIVVDTPPAQNAIDFLRAPRRLQTLLDERVLQLFSPVAAQGLVGKVARAGTALLTNILGDGFQGLMSFVKSARGLFRGVRDSSVRVEELLQADSTGFLAVTTPDASKASNLHDLREWVAEADVSLDAIVLNRSWSAALPAQPLAALDASTRALMKPLADMETRMAESDEALGIELREVLKVPVLHTPRLVEEPTALNDLAVLSASFA